MQDGDLKEMKEMSEEKRRSARRKEFIMAELLETERSYVKVGVFKCNLSSFMLLNLISIPSHHKWLMPSGSLMITEIKGESSPN